MSALDTLVRNPVKVAVGVLLIALFGVVALSGMPMQLTPEVQRPTISIRTDWPGASPQEFEREIVDQQEEYLRSVEGVQKMSSSSYGPAGRITLEFAIGTDINEALLKVNSRLQQVPEYPEEVREPVITTSNFADRPIAWFVLGPRPPKEADYEAFLEQHPELAADLEPVRAARNTGLAMFRLRRLAEKNEAFEPLLPEERNVAQKRLFVKRVIESAFERVQGVARADVHGGLENELQVVVDPNKLAAQGLTITDVREALRGENDNVPGGYFDEGKRRWFVRTLGRFETPEQVENELLAVHNDAPVYVRDVADVRLGFEDPHGLVRRFGTSSIAVSVIRENGANVLDVMQRLRDVTGELNAGPLDHRGLHLTQLYDETDYINSALDLVESNIFVGGALTMIVLMAFLHLSVPTMLAVPVIIATALAATWVSPWFFAATLVLILGAGFWFARGALVVGLAIPVSIVGTFLMMDLFGRSLNVVSLAGLAFAVGMFVDNAVVVMESIVRRQQELDEPPLTAAVRGTKDVWGAVLASTLTTIAVFLPVIFVEQEAGQLFRDIALAISAAMGLSLLVSTTVIPTAAARLFKSRGDGRAPAGADPGGNGRVARVDRKEPPDASSVGSLRSTTATPGRVVRAASGLGERFAAGVVGVNRWTQRGLLRRLAVVGLLVGISVGGCYVLWPEVEYLPTGNRNLIVGTIRPPTGYNYEQMMVLGERLEQNLRSHWDTGSDAAEARDDSAPVIEDFFYVVDTWRVFMAVQARDPARAAELIPLVREAGADLPGTLVTAEQSGLFAREMAGGREIDVEISGPDLEKLTAMARQSLDTFHDADPDQPGDQPLLPAGQVRANPELEMASPEVHVRAKSFQAQHNDMSTAELGYVVDALVDGALAGNYYLEGEEIDLVIEGQRQYANRTQDLERAMIATPSGEVVPLQAVASSTMESGPEQIDHREGMRAITLEVTPSQAIPLQEAMQRIRTQIVRPLEESGQLTGPYRIDLAGTADKLNQAWDALRFNLLLALLITYLLMAALFESWLHPFVIIFSVPLGAVGGILGLQLLNVYLGFLDSLGVHGIRVQQLDVLTMLGFVILIGTVVNNPILIVHKALNHMREDVLPQREAILESTRTRIRPIFMTTTTTCLGLAPLVLFPGAGSELYRGLGSVVLGGLLVSTVFTLLLVPTLFSLVLDARRNLLALLRPRSETAPAEQPAPSRPAPQQPAPSG